MATEHANGIRQRLPSVAAEPTPVEFRGSEGSMIHTILAIIIWLGAIHFNFIVVSASFLFLPLPKFFAVLGVLVIFMVLPLDDKSKWGRKLARYICRNVCRYFPVTLHVEDINAFDAKQAYGRLPQVKKRICTHSNGDGPTLSSSFLLWSGLPYPSAIRCMWWLVDQLKLRKIHNLPQKRSTNYTVSLLKHSENSLRGTKQGLAMRIFN